MEEILQAIRNNEIVIVTDDEDRENEGDFICAGENVTGEMINLMATYGKGLICTPISEKIADKLSLGQMVATNTDNHSTAFTVSIDHVDTTTGISAFERALTIRSLCDEASKPSDLRRPGHVFPLVAKEGGVLVRDGHTEATIDLLELAGLKPVGVCCEIMAADGHMLRGEALVNLAKELGLKITSVAEIKKYKLEKLRKEESQIEATDVINLPTDYGDFKAISFLDKISGEEHIALIKGDIEKEDVLTRIHSECLTGDIFGSRRCDCGSQLHKALEKIDKEGSGVLVYLRQEGRGIGLFNKIKAYKLQEDGYDTVDANLELGFPEDMRDYKVGADILRKLGVKSIRLMTNNPDNIEQIEKYNIKVRYREPLEIQSNESDVIYLKTKAERMGHELKEFKGAR